MEFPDTSSFRELGAFENQSIDPFYPPEDAPPGVEYDSRPHTDTEFRSGPSQLISDTSSLGEMTAAEYQPLELLFPREDVSLLSQMGNSSRGYAHSDLRPNSSHSFETIASQPQHHSNEAAIGGLPPATCPSRGLIRDGNRVPTTDEREGFNPRDTGWRSPLHIAAHKGHDRIVRLLVRHDRDCNEKDGDSMTPLIHAVIGGYEDVVSTLLQHAARVSEADAHGRSSIHWAVFQQRKAILDLLLENCHGLNAAVNAYDDNGETPLHTAIDVGFEEGVQTLLRYGADLRLRSRKTD